MSTMEQTEARRTPFSARRLLFWIHIGIGLSLGIPFALLGITGSILVYEQGIDEFFSPAPRATAVGEMRSPQAIIDAAFASGAGSVAQTLALPSERGAPAIVRLAGGARGQGQRPLVNQVYIDPVSLDVLDVRPAARAYWMGIVHDLHGSMLLGGRQGRPLVGWFGVGMLALGLSGIVLWWPRATWRGAYGVKKDARGWLFYRQLHGTAGITAWLLFIVLSFSGIVIAFPQTTTALVRTSMGLGPSGLAPVGPSVPQLRVAPVEGAERIDADRALALAVGAVPNTRLVNILLPNAPEQPIRVNLLPEAAPQGAPAVTVTIDPYRGETMSVRDPWAGDVGDDVMAWQRPLHTGRGTNAIYRLAIFAVGLLPPLFAITGIAMWWTKRRARAVAGREGRAMEGVPAE